MTQLWIHGYGYEEEHNTPIHLGKTDTVPEPGALALLAVGIPGLYAMRRRRAKQKEIVK